MEGIAHMVEAHWDCGIAEEGIVAGSSLRGRFACCSQCTMAQLEGAAAAAAVDSGDRISVAPYLVVAYSAALPADDDRSSCLPACLEMLPSRSRSRRLRSVCSPVRRRRDCVDDEVSAH